jgi:hypothetical protein
LSYHFLSAGFDETHAVCVTGRLNRTTAWIPLEKTQSIRRIQGPLQRRFDLASVHVDVAGRRTRGEFRDRDVEEADYLVTRLAELSRRARLQPSTRLSRQPSARDPVAPAGWFADPSGRNEWRYWDGQRWTDHVGNGGVTTLDPR